MRDSRSHNPGLLLLLCAVLPFLSDAAIPVPPASSAASCNVASSYASSIFPGGNGDEGFFGLPIGAPANAMILLDNSTSMFEFPIDIPYPSTLASGTGTCSGTVFNDVDVTGTNGDTPYDNGTSNAFIVDNPPWGLNRCSTGSNDCLFVPTHYYKYQQWNTSGATEYQTGSASGRICYNTPNTAQCQNCLDTAGYYLFRNSTGARNAYFKGKFLNVFPPKFVIARKVVKDLIAIDLNQAQPHDSVRFGLTVFQLNADDASGQTTALRAQDGGFLVVPLGPDCDSAQGGFIPANQISYQTARQAIVTAVNDPTIVSFATYTPLAESLFNIGQYYSDISTSSTTGGLYDTVWPVNWVRASTTAGDGGNNFRQTSPGAINAAWTTSSSNQKSICWECQQSTAIIVTDGEPTADNNIPKNGVTSKHTTGPVSGVSSQNDFRRWTYSGFTCPSPGCGGSLLPMVSYFLYHNDMRSDLDNDRQVQTVVTHAISFGLPEGVATTVLRKTAQLGGGRFYNTSSGDELKSALFNAVADTVARSTSFSVSNTNTLQTGTNNNLFLARFRKLLGKQWEGHLYRFKLFNEFVQGCDKNKPTASQTLVQCKKKDGTMKSPALNPNLDGKEDCHGLAICDEIFILDGDCDPVTEDDAGNFVKGTFNASHQLVATTTPSNWYWDAGYSLSNSVYPSDYHNVALRGQPVPGYRSADETATNARKIYTVIDSDGDGAFTSADTRVEFTADNAAAIAPLLDINNAACASLLERAGLCTSDPSLVTAILPLCPDPAPATWVPANTTLCAKQIILYTRGWDVLDEDADDCAGPGNPNNATSCPGTPPANGEERNRTNDARVDREFWKLGDIFHSSPILVKPPISPDICEMAIEPQCMATLLSPHNATTTLQTPDDYDINGNGAIDTGETAYKKYFQDQAQRRQIVLVGSNDGLLHAFDAGAVDPAGTPDMFGQYPYLVGDGAELWAFVPPDLLPKLKMAMSDEALNSHVYFVDGNTMVRDVWVDANKNGIRSPNEFHTLAVLTERSGGVSSTALDVTDPIDPKFLWTFPPNCSTEQALVGQSWSGFSPRPPPIGPVKLKLPYAGAPSDPTGRSFEERWIVMLNGGYDAALVRGRGVWMLDVYTGKVLWRFTDKECRDLSICSSSASLWPVPASVGLVDIEPGAGAGTQAGDGFFDSANWPDMGGQLWVARFNAPGVLDATGIVNNWYVARAFEEQRQVSGKQNTAGRHEFFYMPSNALDGDRLHSYLGSGNRDYLLQTGAECGSGNLLSCCQSGCSGGFRTTYNFGTCSVASTAQCIGGNLEYTADAITGSCTTGFTPTLMNAQVRVDGSGPASAMICGGAGNPPAFSASLQCNATGVCDDPQRVKAEKLVAHRELLPNQPNPASTNPNWHARFYGIWSYGTPRVFDSSASAKTFDNNRFTDVAWAGSCIGTPGTTCTLIDTTYASVSSSGAVTCDNGTTKCAATKDDAGWFYEYGRKCPLKSGCDIPPWLDEKTGSGSTILAGCVDWNTFRPRGGDNLDPCIPVNATSSAKNYTYLSDFITGTPTTSCGFNPNNQCVMGSPIYRASQRNTIAPPPDPTQIVGIGMDGEVRTSGIQIEPGGNPSAAQLGATRDLSEPMFWLETPRELHVCRHVDASRCR